MINFTVGPVQMDDEIRQMGAEQVPYFRTPEFSETMRDSERIVKELAGAGENSRAVFLTGSGTAAMEAAVMHVFSGEDKVLVVNGGSFGRRFVELCEIHQVPFTEISVPFGKDITEEMLRPYENQGYTGFLINVHETSTGVHYNMELVSEFCKKNHLFLVADSISSFLADPFSMEELGVQVMIAGSQKALACPPGVSILVLSKEAVKRIESHPSKCMYLDLKSALKNGERGQTPFTPAVGILLQIHARLKKLEENGGAETEIRKIGAIAKDFREKIKDLPLRIVSESLSNAVTPLEPLNGQAYSVFMTLKDEYGIWVCPNGGELQNKVFRVGHLGHLTAEDNSRLAEALKDLVKRGLL